MTLRICHHVFTSNEGRVDFRPVTLAGWTLVGLVTLVVLVALAFYCAAVQELGMAVFLTFLAFAGPVSAFLITIDNRRAKPLIEWRNGRLLICSVDAGPSDRIDVSVTKGLNYHLVSIEWPDEAQEPHLIWRAKRLVDAEALRALVIEALPVSTWPPAPVNPAVISHYRDESARIIHGN